MVIVLHGEDQVTSRKRLSDIRAYYEDKNWEIVIAPKGVSLEEINLSSRAQTLLGESSIVVVEDFFVGKRTTKDLTFHLTSGNVVFWEGRELPKTLINSFLKDWKIENFSIPQATFKFLDALIPGKPQNALRMLHGMLDEDAYSLLPLLSWHTRYLIWAKEEPETLNLPVWRKEKLKNQASRFKIDSLYMLHEQILSLDREIKAGKNVLPPLASLELLIVNL